MRLRQECDSHTRGIIGIHERELKNTPRGIYAHFRGIGIIARHMYGTIFEYAGFTGHKAFFFFFLSPPPRGDWI